MYRRVPLERVRLSADVVLHYSTVGARELALYIAQTINSAEIGEEFFVGTTEGHGWMVIPGRSADGAEWEALYRVPPGTWRLTKPPPTGTPPRGPRRGRRR
ncbi:MAG: hypothetical protein HYV42_05570 [Candidatus Magasanikbacteria bacterium]|nr:hypothetical protein [Candidatus Magasanikbacteria bacterium]